MADTVQKDSARQRAAIRLFHHTAIAEKDILAARSDFGVAELVHEAKERTRDALARKLLDAIEAQGFSGTVAVRLMWKEQEEMFNRCRNVCLDVAIVTPAMSESEMVDALRAAGYTVTDNHE